MLENHPLTPLLRELLDRTLLNNYIQSQTERDFWFERNLVEHICGLCIANGVSLQNVMFNVGGERPRHVHLWPKVNLLHIMIKKANVEAVKFLVDHPNDLARIPRNVGHDSTNNALHFAGLSTKSDAGIPVNEQAIVKKNNTNLIEIMKILSDPQKTDHLEIDILKAKAKQQLHNDGGTLAHAVCIGGSRQVLKWLSTQQEFPMQALCLPRNDGCRPGDIGGEISHASVVTIVNYFATPQPNSNNTNIAISKPDSSLGKRKPEDFSTQKANQNDRSMPPQYVDPRVISTINTLPLIPFAFSFPQTSTTSSSPLGKRKAEDAVAQENNQKESRGEMPNNSQVQTTSSSLPMSSSSSSPQTSTTSHAHTQQTFFDPQAIVIKTESPSNAAAKTILRNYQIRAAAITIRGNNNAKQNCSHLVASLMDYFDKGVIKTALTSPSLGKAAPNKVFIKPIKTEDGSKPTIQAYSSFAFISGAQSNVPPPEVPYVEPNGTIDVERIVVDLESDKHERIQCSHKNMNEELLAKAKDAIIYGEITLGRCMPKLSGHKLAFYAVNCDSDKRMVFIDPQFYDGINKIGEPLFFKLEDRYRFLTPGVQPDDDTYSSSFYLIYKTIKLKPDPLAVPDVTTPQLNI